ncbi:sugar phosphate isomerase/epimerase [Streptomyces sp. MK37H]|uniref:sugar phosphate isomerase/epimerase family protein n=1 Tax=Streptomyces sp. MK37H TaxID=2699117 RepID=UPI001B3729FE|nr:sugar phosphate isomerase/epimerase [Streptomyces sp. MK37H]MBP8533233.1 TIM barrel protein [Streptomyces sp. MK37H]
MAPIGINPLPWYLTADGLSLSREILPGVYREVREAGFDAVQADVPPGTTVADFRTLLDDHGLRAAPGYFSAAFEEPATEAARVHASQQAQLGLTEVFIAPFFAPERREHPAVGHAFDAGRLATITDNLGKACEVITAEGLRPCLHPHVGTWVETEQEIRTVLDAIDPVLLAFGPDTGHLHWAGVDPVALITEYADRVGAVHIKDVHTAAARITDGDYAEATYGRHVWTEPGHGDVDLAGAVAALPAGYDGWFVVEVDVPDQGDGPKGSAELSHRWVADHLATTDVSR